MFRSLPRPSSGQHKMVKVSISLHYTLWYPICLQNVRKNNYKSFKVKMLYIFIIIVIIIISFMQGIYTYIPETNCVPREYSVAAVLLLLFMVLISLVSVLNLLYFYISTFCSMCAVPNMAVFCSSLTSCFPVCCSRIF